MQPSRSLPLLLLLLLLCLFLFVVVMEVVALLLLVRKWDLQARGEYSEERFRACPNY